MFLKDYSKGPKSWNMDEFLVKYIDEIIEDTYSRVSKETDDKKKLNIYYIGLDKIHNVINEGLNR